MILRILRKASPFFKRSRPLSIEPKIYDCEAAGISKNRLSKEAVFIVRTLRERGYDAYIVGGAVRDLLMQKTPKDYDIVTSALPKEVCASFSRTRIIGRRFQIVHVYIGGSLFEVTTLRNYSKRGVTSLFGKRRVDAKGTVLRDNLFGKHIQEDVQGRDFTVNAFYLNPLSGELYDFFDGITHLKEKRLVMIGEADRRFSEDPVRMLRFIRFSASLGFEADGELLSLLKSKLSLLSEVNESRLLEEYKKLFIQPKGPEVFAKMRELGAAAQLFPVYQDSTEERAIVDQALLNTKTRLESGKSAQIPFLLSAFLWIPFWRMVKKAATDKKGRLNLLQLEKLMTELLRRNRHRYTQNIRERILRIWALQFRMESTDPASAQAKGLRFDALFRAAFDFLKLRALSGNAPEELVGAWLEHYEHTPTFQENESSDSPEPSRQKRRRRRRPNRTSSEG